MKSSTESLSPTRIKLTIEVPFEEFEPSLDEAYKTIGSQVTVPGFRKGKVPAAVVDQRVGRGVVLDEAINNVLPQWYSQAVQEQEIQPLSQPEIDLTKFSDGEPIEITAELDIRPEITLPGRLGHHGRGRRRRGRRRRRRRADRGAARALRHLHRGRARRRRTATRSPSTSPPPTRTASPSRAPRPRACPTRSARARSSTVSTRPSSASRPAAPPRSPASWSAASSRARTSRSPSRSPTSRSGTCPSSTTSSPRWPRSSTRSTSCAPTCLERVTRGKRMEQANEARDIVLDEIIGQVDVPLPDGAGRRGARRRAVSRSPSSSPSPALSMEAYLEDEGQTAEEFEADLERRVRESIVAAVRARPGRWPRTSSASRTPS